ncbi:MAG: putative membrane protein YdjX (TVP38/TMEM64 family), partial [Halioglobus sp.]
MRSKQILILGILGAAAFGWFYFDLGSYLQLDTLRESLSELLFWRTNNPVLSAFIFFIAYVAVAGLSIPGAAIMTLAGGALFGFWTGLLLASFASSIGATLAFLMSRTLLRDWVQKKFGRHL